MNDTQSYIDAALARGAKPFPEGMRVIAEVYCGCADPELAWTWTRDYLQACANFHNSSIKPYQLTTGAEIVCAYLFDHLRLTEHGGSVNGAWLTDLGEQALTFLTEYGANWEDAGCEFIDRTGCSHAIKNI